MKIVCFSLYGNFSPIMERIGQEIGNQNILMLYYYRDYRKWWDGLLNKPELKYEKGVAINAKEEINKFRPDFVIFDMAGEGNIADEIKNSGIDVIGSCEFCDFLELNRWYGNKIFETMGFNTPSTIQAKDFKTARDFINSRSDKDERWVIKFNDNQGNFSSYVSTDIDDMLEELEHFNESNRVDFTRGAIIQEYIKGIELSCEGWFNGDNWVEDGFNYTMEEKKFLTGSLGPSTGCEGNLVWKASPEDIIPKQLYRLTPILRKYGYIGPFDVNNIIATEEHQYDGFKSIKIGKNYILEPTPRFGYDAIYTLLEGYKGKISELFAGLVNKSLDSIELEDMALLGVRVSIPPYPYNDISRTEDKIMERLARKTIKYMEKSVEGTIVGVDDLTKLRHIFFQDIRLNGKNRLIVNGTDSVIAVVTQQGTTLEKAVEETYKIVKVIDAPDMQYRLDIGKRAFTEIPELVKLEILEQPAWLTSSDEKNTQSLLSNLEFEKFDFSEMSEMKDIVEDNVEDDNEPVLSRTEKPESD